MLTLFRIDSKNKLVIDKDATKMVPEFKNLKTEQLMYIVLAYDYRSKFHQWPEEERKRKACFEVYGTIDKDPEDGKIISKAIEGYIGLQYDSRIETIKAYNEKVFKLNGLLRDADSPKDITDNIKSVEQLTQRIEAIRKEIDSEQLKEIELRGDGKLSLVEKIHMMENNFSDYVRMKRKIN